MTDEFEKWWLEANEGANTSEADAKYPMVKELARAAYSAGASAMREKCASVAELYPYSIDGCSCDMCCGQANAISSAIERVEI